MLKENNVDIDIGMTLSRLLLEDRGSEHRRRRKLRREDSSLRAYNVENQISRNHTDFNPLTKERNIKISFNETTIIDFFSFLNRARFSRSPARRWYWRNRRRSLR